MIYPQTANVDTTGVIRQMPINKIKKPEWRVISARISPDQRDLLKKKHPKEGEISEVLRQLIDKYLAGKIFGIKIELNNVS